MKKRSLFACAVMLLAVMILLSACSGNNSSSTQASTSGSTAAEAASTVDDGKTYTLVVSSQQPETEVVNSGINYWAAEIEKRTNGRVKVDIQYSGVLGKQGTEVEMLQSGICDIAVASISSNADKWPLLSFITVPGMVPDAKSSAAALDAIVKAGYLDKTFADNGIKLLWWQCGESAHIFINKKNVESLENLKGLKIGYPGGEYSKMMLESLGATATGINPADLYLSLNTGVLDGCLFAPRFMYDSKNSEVTTSMLTSVTGYGGCNSLFISQSSWDKLPVDIQNTIDQLNVEAREKYFDTALALYNDSNKMLTDSGVKICQFSKEEDARWKKALEGVVDDWITKTEAKGYPAREVAELVQSTVAEYAGK